MAGLKKQKICYSRRGICLAQTITQEVECLHFAPAKGNRYYQVCVHRGDDGKCQEANRAEINCKQRERKVKHEP